MCCVAIRQQPFVQGASPVATFGDCRFDQFVYAPVHSFHFTVRSWIVWGDSPVLDPKFIHEVRKTGGTEGLGVVCDDFLRYAISRKDAAQTRLQGSCRDCFHDLHIWISTVVIDTDKQIFSHGKGSNEVNAH